MSGEPREPGLAAVFRATVRVAGGSGVVIRNGGATLVATAAHVVRGADVHWVRGRGCFGEGSVIARDESLDVALVTPPRELEPLALRLADDEQAGRPGDSVWAAGFPSGWDGPDPVLAPGAIAGVGEKNWVNFDGTWGNSGGPICRLVGRDALFVGVLLGNASRSSEEMTSWANDLGRVQREVEGQQPQLEEQLSGLEKMLAEVRDLPPIKADDLPSGGLKARAEKLGARLKEHHADLERAQQTTGLVQQIGQIFSSQLAGLRAMSEFIDQHFRTGFLRFASVADLRKLLE